ncbi:hypothetical protein D0809_17055 [Flavobacterium circumlabens]|uniref:Uncharacterized protein n=1 Tax=Flavobacterium circumlabens TaxID=2133765 RepID=A0A4Y7U9N4_9FLAO|nr:hypothetical protein D0809_17055 [Flavobacterium circumlabens]
MPKSKEKTEIVKYYGSYLIADFFLNSKVVLYWLSFVLNLRNYYKQQKTKKHRFLALNFTNVTSYPVVFFTRRNQYQVK